MPSLIFNRADVADRLNKTRERIAFLERCNRLEREVRIPQTGGVELHRLRLLADTYVRLLGGKGSSVQFSPR